MRRLALDLRSLLRSWRRDKLAVAAAVLALALGFGAGGVALTLVERIALTPAPYDRPDQLVFVESVHPEAASEGRVSMADYLDWREQSQVFSHLAVFREYSFTLLAPGVEPEELHATLASPALFQVLRRQAVLGRSFLAEEEIPGNDAVVLLSHGLWQRRFEGDAGVLGRQLRIPRPRHRALVPPRL